MSDKFTISPYRITLKSSIKVRRMKKIITVLRSSWSLVNSPYQYLWAVRRICTLMLGVKSKSQLCEVQPFCWANQMLANFTKIYKDITSLLLIQINNIIYLSAWIFDRLSFDRGFCFKLLFSAVQEQKRNQITMIEMSMFVYSHTP